ncbi:hypothetical protein B0F90DRAFT_1637270 [Multifurca ochricompacta]|uniref:BZIP domain-containing protein n=1 Tax=Multifurca ochricompacta TaxID=376703 RepID=A0AAD4M199_9AGAM|nr:hypothetical protein B0F90DRAFT_1637270 [Multifurca ochricompacta]
MRLRQDPPPVTQTQPRSRKRKTPPSTDALHSVVAQPSLPTSMQHTLPPAHTLVPPPHLSGHVIPPPPPGYQYPPPGDYSTAGLPPPHSLAPPPSAEGAQEQRPQSQPSNGAMNTTSTGTSRTLSQSKRAEQNRKAQRAFRERRDQHVKALESRSQLLDAALASADEANRRWEECRALVDQLRIENAALRAALSQAQMMTSGGSSVPPPGVGEDNRSAVASILEGTKSTNEPKE